jgi:hypothetical protein
MVESTAIESLQTLTSKFFSSALHLLDKRLHHIFRSDFDTDYIHVIAPYGKPIDFVQTFAYDAKF